MIRRSPSPHALQANDINGHHRGQRKLGESKAYSGLDTLLFQDLEIDERIRGGITGRAIDAQTQSENMVQKAIGGNFANPLWNLRDFLSKDLSYPRLLAIPAKERSRPIGEYSLMAQHIKEYSLMYRGTELIGADRARR